MLSFFFKKREQVVEVENLIDSSKFSTNETNEWVQVYSPEELLNTVYRKKLLYLIWQRVSMDSERFNLLYRSAINNYARIVQLLPASESHHHSYWGGMLDHGLEVVNFGLKLRQPYLLPIGGAAEEISRQAEAWSAAVMYGSLLHDIGKIVVDIIVEKKTGEIWRPWDENIQEFYRVKYNSKREYKLHPSAGALMIQKIVPVEGITWLSQYPDVFSAFLHLCAGHYDKAGVLGEIIQKADMASVSQNLGGDPVKATTNRPLKSIADKIVNAIRYLFENEIKLNTSGASDGWYDGSDVWVVSKTFTDKLRAHLMQHGITDIPSNNAKIFDILKENKIAITNDDKTIWTCKIEAENGWIADRLTLIRFSVGIAFSNIVNAPNAFAGKIMVIESSNLTNSEIDTNSNIENIPRDNSKLDIENDKKISKDITSDVLALFDSGAPNNIVTNESEKDNDDVVEPVQPFNHPFLKWAREQILTGGLKVNTQTSNIHTVNGKIFMVSPGIFKKYCLYTDGNDDNWKSIQLEFQSLKLHLKFGHEKYNIWKCYISGKRVTKKNNKIMGYLIDCKELFAIDNNIPDNPHLKLIENDSDY